jgi:hypothetical protein
MSGDKLKQVNIDKGSRHHLPSTDDEEFLGAEDAPFQDAEPLAQLAMTKT